MLNVLSIINLVVAVQSLFLCFHFVLKTKGIKPLNLLLALLCFCFFFLLANTYVSLSAPELQTLLFQDLANNVMWFIGPSLYLYVIYNKQQLSSWQMAFHLLPFLIPAFIDIVFNWLAFDNIIPFIGFTQMLIYLGLSLVYCFKNYKKEQQFYSWVLPSIIAFTVLVLINFGLRIMSYSGVELITTSVLQSFTTLLSFPIFYIAYKEMNAPHAYGIPPKKYKSTPLSKEKSELYLTTIIGALEHDKLYRDATLKLSGFATQTKIPAKYISQLINQRLQLSFTEYLTKLRIEDAKLRLKDPKKQQLTISGIAQESGFASSSRFNYLFKKHTGLTPSQYQKQP